MQSGDFSVVSGVLQSTVLSLLLYTNDLPDLRENTLIGYSDDSTLLADIFFTYCTVPVVSSLYGVCWFISLNTSSCGV